MYRVVVLLLCLAALVGVQVVKHASTQRQEVQQLPRSTPRTVYPYSVVAGGVQSAAEVKAAMHDDATIAAHYAALNVAELKPIKQVGDVRRYVSYRVNGAISWTSKPVTIKDGELLLTDGSTTLRGRCGNMLSETPKQPTQASSAEPRVDELDNPIPLGYVSQLSPAQKTLVPAESGIPQPTSVALSLTPMADEASQTLQLQPPAPMPSMLGTSTSSPSASAQSAGMGPFIPGPFGPPLILPSAQGFTNVTPNPATQGPTDVAATPEPSTMAMIGLGFVGLFLLNRARARKF